MIRAMETGSWYQETYDAIIDSLEDLRDLDVPEGSSNRLRGQAEKEPHEASAWYQSIRCRISQCPGLAGWRMPRELYERFDYIKPRWQRLERELKTVLEQLISTSDAEQAFWISAFHKALEQLRHVQAAPEVPNDVPIAQTVLQFERDYRNTLDGLTNKQEKHQQRNNRKEDSQEIAEFSVDIANTP